MKKLSLIAGGVASLGLAAMLAGPSFAADHADSTTLLTMPMGDINDVYTWMTPDASKLILAMSVSPLDDGSAARDFSDAYQYVWHVWSRGTTPATSVGRPGMGTETRVICTFASNTSIQCWVVTGTTVKDYVTGDPSSSTGLVSADGKMKVFAGRRSDPFFFNLGGFRSAIATIEQLEATMPALFAPDAAGCPSSLPDATTVRTQLAGQSTDAGSAPACPTVGQKDCFATLNVKMIVVQLDKGLVNDGTNTNLAVYATTHAKP